MPMHLIQSLRTVRAAARGGWWHPCAIPDCRTEVGRRKRLCRPHRKALPSEFRTRLWWLFNPGQTTQSQAYRDAAKEAGEYLATSGESGPPR